MPALFGLPSYPLWAAMEACPPYRVIGLYGTRYTAAQRAIEFGSPAVVEAVADVEAAYQLAMKLRVLREGR